MVTRGRRRGRCVGARMVACRRASSRAECLRYDFRAVVRAAAGLGPRRPKRGYKLRWAMRSDRVISAVDFHTAGIGMRLLTSGLGRLPGSTIGEKRRWFQEHLDHMRTGLCLEPRGHRSLLIAVLTEAVTAGGDFRLFLHFPGGDNRTWGEGTAGRVHIVLCAGVSSPAWEESPLRHARL